MKRTVPHSIRTTLRGIDFHLRSQCRRLHLQAKPLASLEAGAPLGSLLSPQGLDSAYYQRMDMYTQRLQQSTAHNPELQATPLERIVAENGRSPAKRELLAAASMLYNLQFAYSSLRGDAKGMLPPGKSTRADLLRTPETAVAFANEPAAQGAHRLQEELASSFRSLVEFRTLLLGSAAAVGGDGYTWLLARQYATPYGNAAEANATPLYDKLFVMNTYNAGSPFNFGSAGMLDKMRGEAPQGEMPPGGELERAREQAVDGTTVYVPLLALDASPKAWLGDYGVFGKQAYLERVWESVDWRVVEQRLPGKSPVVYA